MDEDALWAAVDAHRGEVVALLGSLDDGEWDRPSLCAGWTVRDVAAHLALQQSGLLDVVKQLRHYRGGGMQGLIHDSARAKAAAPTARLIAEIDAMRGSRRHNFGVTPRETLIDILVHDQDIAVPLGRRLPLPPEPAAEAATRLCDTLDRPTVRGLFRAVPWGAHRLTATDIAWTRGEGPEVRGAIGALLLLVAGRVVALDELTGDGVDSLRAALT